MLVGRSSTSMLVVAIGIAFGEVHAAAAQTLAIQAGHIIDPGLGTVSDRQTIVIRDGKIVEVGSAVSVPRDAQMIDLQDSWVLPGLIDAHTHMTFSRDMNESTGAYYLRESSGLRALRGPPMLAQFWRLDLQQYAM